MTIQSIKTYLYNKACSTASSIKQATPTVIDQMCMDAIGAPYLYALRPLAIGLHGYFRTQDNGPNIAYNALALTGGSFVRSLPPVNYAINVACGATGRIASCALNVIRAIPLPTPIACIVNGIGQDTAAMITEVVKDTDPEARLPQGEFMRLLVPFVAKGYLGFRISHFLTRIFPFIVASQFTQIRAKPRYPNKTETLFWLVSTLYMACTGWLPKIQKDRDRVALVQDITILKAQVAAWKRGTKKHRTPLFFQQTIQKLKGELARVFTPESREHKALAHRLQKLEGELSLAKTKTAPPKLLSRRWK